MQFDIHKIISELRKGILPSISYIVELIEKTIPLFITSPNIVPVQSPCVLVGDLHGQFYDFLFLLEKVDFFNIPKNIVFLGDVVDRGYYSTETITMVLSLKLAYPDFVTLIRGNHESKQITQVYGFYDELRHRINDQSSVSNNITGFANDLNKINQNSTTIAGNTKPNLQLGESGTALWRRFIELFDVLPIGALVDGQSLCVHGGIPRNIPSLAEIKAIHRTGEIPLKGEICDMLWSDPYESLKEKKWMPNSRGAGIGFSESLLFDFMQKNNLKKIFRSHQLVMEGYKKHFTDDKLVTIWSAPNYCYRCGNLASIAEIGNGTDGRTENYIIFGAVDKENRQVPSSSDRIDFMREM
eukprot:GAHX01002246.1.p1 GENE.GAHX01002246.1~~GAHX01002246.1.p1  ORF type:complete len:355 (-),score=51.70 GAHX01002246.1:31-1095(-)